MNLIKIITAIFLSFNLIGCFDKEASGNCLTEEEKKTDRCQNAEKNMKKTLTDGF